MRTTLQQLLLMLLLLLLLLLLQLFQFLWIEIHTLLLRLRTAACWR